MSKNHPRHRLLLPLVAISLLLSGTLLAEPMKLLDPAFAAELCKAWNQTSLPSNLGRSGSGWIDSADSKGRQVLVVARRDCKGWRRVQLVIEVDAKGQAMCTSGGAWNGKDKFTWRFEPTTLHWADFSDGFGTFDMPKIMSGFVGPYGTAMKNLGNFGVFFAATGKLALDKKVDWACDGADPKDVAEEVADIDRADMNEVLAGK